jgi:excisionase family DNA binding protein
MLRDVLTAVEAASTLNLHPETVKRFCRIGKLHGEKVNGGWLISKTEVESFVSTYKETRGRPANGRAHPNAESG